MVRRRALVGMIGLIAGLSMSAGLASAQPSAIILKCSLGSEGAWYIKFEGSSASHWNEQTRSWAARDCEIFYPNFKVLKQPECKTSISESSLQWTKDYVHKDPDSRIKLVDREELSISRLTGQIVYRRYVQEIIPDINVDREPINTGLAGSCDAARDPALESKRPKF